VYTKTNIPRGVLTGEWVQLQVAALTQAVVLVFDSLAASKAMAARAGRGERRNMSSARGRAKMSRLLLDISCGERPGAGLELGGNNSVLL